MVQTFLVNHARSVKVVVYNTFGLSQFEQNGEIFDFPSSSRLLLALFARANIIPSANRVKALSRWGKKRRLPLQISIRVYQKMNHRYDVSFSSHFHFLTKASLHLLTKCLEMAANANTDSSPVFSYLSLFKKEGRQSWIRARLTHNEGLSW